jgi:hypothetical protein
MPESMLPDAFPHKINGNKNADSQKNSENSHRKLEKKQLWGALLKVDPIHCVPGDRRISKGKESAGNDGP